MAAIKLLKRNKFDITLTCLETLDEATKKELGDIKIYDGGHPMELLDIPYKFIVKNPGIPYFVPFIKEAVKRNFKIITEIELGYMYSDNVYLAITGTNGKTTTTQLVYELVKSSFENTFLAGNIGTPLCDVVLDHPRQNYIVMEVSSFQLMGCYKFRPYVSTIMNLSPDHLDYNETLEEYYLSKTSIYKQQDQYGYFIRNLDDANVETFVKDVPATELTLSMHDENADIHTKDGYIIYKDEKVMRIKNIKLIGDHNIYNVMFAIAYAKIVNVSNKTIDQVVSNYVGVPYRLENVGEDKDKNIVYYNDSKSTSADSTLTALKAFDKKKVVLILGGKDKGLDYKELIDYINEHKNIVSVLSFGEIKDAFKECSKNKTFDTLYELMTYVKDNYKKVNVLFSPATSSFDQYENYEARGEHFNSLVKL